MKEWIVTIQTHNTVLVSRSKLHTKKFTTNETERIQWVLNLRFPTSVTWPAQTILLPYPDSGSSGVITGLVMHAQSCAEC